MIKIGITGNIGSGKSFISRIFNEEYGIPVYYTDIVSRKISQRPIVKEKYVEIFGNDVLLKNGNFNRKLIADILFIDKEKRDKISFYVAGLMEDDFSNWCAVKRIGPSINKKNKRIPYVLCESAIFDETETKHFVDLTLGVDAPMAIRMERVMKRNYASREDFMIRNNAQKNHDNKISECDFIINNSGELDILYKDIARLDRLFKNISKISNPNLG